MTGRSCMGGMTPTLRTSRSPSTTWASTSRTSRSTCSTSRCRPARRFPLPRPRLGQPQPPLSRQQEGGGLRVYDYLPPMYPEIEEVEADYTFNVDTKEAEEEASMAQASTPNSKRSRVAGLTPKQSADGCPLLREISSVMMMASGFLSPCCEGKLDLQLAGSSPTLT